MKRLISENEITLLTKSLKEFEDRAERLERGGRYSLDGIDFSKVGGEIAEKTNFYRNKGTGKDISLQYEARL